MDDLLSLLWSVAWGAFWDAELWATLVVCLQGRDMEGDEGVEVAGVDDAESGRDVLLKVKRNIVLLWSVVAAGRLLARSCRSSQAAGETPPDTPGPGHVRWMQEEGELCRDSLRRIVGMWDSDVFEIRKAQLVPASPKTLPDAHTDMLRQALRALRVLEPDGTGAKVSRRKGAASSERGRGHLLRFLDGEGSLKTLLELEKQVLLRGTQLDQVRCKGSAEVRQEVHAVLLSLGHRVRLEDDAILKLAASSNTHVTASPPAAAAAGDADRERGGPGWLVVEVGKQEGETEGGTGRIAMVHIYGRPDYADLLAAGDPLTSPHLTASAAPVPGRHAGMDAVESSAAAALGMAPRVLTTRWRIWEEQAQAAYGCCVLPLAADVWQECQEDVAHVGLEGGEAGAPEVPMRPSYLTQLLEHVPAELTGTGAEVPGMRAGAAAGKHGDEGGSPVGAHAGEVDVGVDDVDEEGGGMSPDSLAGDLEGMGEDSPMEVENGDEVNGEGSDGGDGVEGAKNGRVKKSKGKAPRKARKGRKRLWKVEYSKSKQRWCVRRRREG